MNQDVAHSFRLHHTGVTDVMNAKRRLVATLTVSGKVSRHAVFSWLLLAGDLEIPANCISTIAVTCP